MEETFDVIVEEIVIVCFTFYFSLLPLGWLPAFPPCVIIVAACYNEICLLLCPLHAWRRCAVGMTIL